MFYGGMVQPKNYLVCARGICPLSVLTAPHRLDCPAGCVLTHSRLLLRHVRPFLPLNAQHTVMQCFTICCLISCIWMIFGARTTTPAPRLAEGEPCARCVCEVTLPVARALCVRATSFVFLTCPTRAPPAGYSLAFRPGTKVIGGASRFWLLGMEAWSVHPLAPTIPESVYMMFQMTFAIITPALIVGGLAERMRFSSLIVFMSAWHLIVYCPIAHSVWATAGFLHMAGILDYAGGSVVHLNRGVAALMCAICLGKRHGHGISRFEPHNVSISLIGASLLWVGWFGFNAGSAGGANIAAGTAMMTTQIATGAGGMSWMFIEWYMKGKPTVMSVISGAVAGLVAITPAAGFVDANGAIIIGFLVGIFCHFTIHIKDKLGFDDALDAVGVHGCGGAFGSLMTGLFAQPKLNQLYPGCPHPNEPCPGPGLAAGQLVSGAFYDHTLPKAYGLSNRRGRQIGLQLYGIVVCAGWSAFASYILLKIIDRLMGLRVDVQDEVEGLDSSVHGESVFYGFDEVFGNNKKLEDSVEKGENGNNTADATVKV